MIPTEISTKNTSSRPKILIVDDRPENLFSLERILKDLDAEVHPAESGNEALVATLNNDFAVILLDVQMPQMDGYELAELLRSEKKTRHVPIIFISAVYSSDFHVFKGYEAGAIDFIVKPFEPSILLHKIGVFLQLAKQKTLLEQANKKLSDANEYLEEKVRERTAELTNSVDILKIEIDKRKQAEKRILQAQKDWQEIFEAIGHMTMILDSDHRVLAANRSTLKNLNVADEELTGRKCYEIFHYTDQPHEHYPVKEIPERPEPQVVETEVMFGEKTYVVSCTPVKDDQGELEKFIHIMTDITKLKELTNDLIQAHKLEAIGMLAGGIAHDFNNILAALLGFTDLALGLAKEKDDEELSEYLNEVSIAGNRAKSLVRQILNFARKRDDALLPVRVDLIVKEVAKFLRSTIPTMIELKTSIDSSSTILANPVKIDQLVMNLCTNAAQAMEDGGKLEISLSDVSLEAGHSFRFKKDLSPGTYLCLEVKDNGTGIRPEIIERIFDPFFTTKPLGEGTGMGLAAVHSIVDDFGGDIAVESELGKGSSFTILLPIIEEEEEVLESEDQITPSTSSESILYVDDEMTICTLARRMLENQGYGVTSTTDALEALEHFKAAPEKFDLVITDMNMPKMAGDKLAGEILAIRPDIPVVIVSGYTEGMSLEQAEKIGVRAIISKPFESKEFTSLVHKVLDEA